MAKKTVISKVLDAEVVDGIIEFPQNKTLYVEQFTDMAPVKPGEVFQPETMEDVFNYYQPGKRNVQMRDLEGRPIKEDFKFGAIKDFDDKDSLISELSTSEARTLLESGTIGGGMLPKLNNCIDAIEHGVSRVHILDGRIPHCLLLEIFTNKGVGTAILSKEAEKFFDTNI